jgi:toluene monooxygenase system ferredoxin subunit
MAFTRVCDVDEVPESDMVSFFVDGYEEVLVLRDTSGIFHAFEGLCPHEDYPLVDGLFDGSTIVCSNHGWIFNAATGRGINPSNCRIREYPIEVKGKDILVDLDGDTLAPTSN